MAAREIELKYGSLLMLDMSGGEVKASLFYTMRRQGVLQVTRQSARAATLDDALRDLKYPDHRVFDHREICGYVRSTPWGRSFR